MPGPQAAENHRWVTDQGRFSRFDIEQPVEVSFASATRQSRTFGPYDHLSAVDGVLYAEQHVFAFYDEQQKDWYAFEDGRHWRASSSRRLKQAARTSPMPPWPGIPDRNPSRRPDWLKSVVSVQSAREPGCQSVGDARTRDRREPPRNGRAVQATRHDADDS